MRQIYSFVIYLFFISISLMGSVFAQNIPYHSDPFARNDAPDPSLLPSIRFLTSNDFAPFNYQNEAGKLIGYHVDLVQAICDQLDVSCTMQVWPFEQIGDALVGNQGDAVIAGIEISEKNAEQFDFSDIYLMFPARFVGLKQQDETSNKEQVFSVRKNSSHAKFLSHYLPDVKVITFDNELEALLAMKNAQVTAFFGDGLRASFWLNENLNCCAFIGEPYFNSQFFGHGLAIAFPAGRSAARDGVNYALSQLKKNKKLDELYLRWFPISFY